jgi:hypothetical protein
LALLRLNSSSEKQLDTRRTVFLGIDIVGVTGSIPVRSTRNSTVVRFINEFRFRKPRCGMGF